MIGSRSSGVADFDLEPPVARHAAAFLAFDATRGCARTADSPACRGRTAATSPNPRGSPRPACCRRRATIRGSTRLRPARVPWCPGGRGIRRRVRCARRNLRRRARPSSWSAPAGRARGGDARASRGRHWPRRNFPAPDFRRCWRSDENMTKQSSGRSRVPWCSSHAPYAFGAMTVAHALAVERGERRVVDDHREMEDAAQRLIARRGFPRAVGSRPWPSRRRLARLCTSTPRSRRLCTKASASGVAAPLRLLSTRCRAPHFTSHSASTLPKPPNAAGDQIACRPA